MNTYIALLRAVNVGGARKIAMAALRSFAAEIGLGDPRTLLQSGNLVFSTDGAEPEVLERTLEKEAEDRLGLSTTFLVRTAAEWRGVVSGNPFTDEARDDPSHLVTLFTREAPSASEVHALEQAIRGREVIHAVGRQVYAVYPDGIGRSKLTHAVIERALGSPCTGRNWNTVLELDRMVGG